jgi:hypothetical protein
MGNGNPISLGLNHRNHIHIAKNNQPTTPISICLDFGIGGNSPGKTRNDEGREGYREIILRR